MEKRYYNAETLKDRLAGYEQRFGLPTEELVALYRVEQVPDSVPAFDAFVWTNTYHEMRRLSCRQTALQLQG